MNRPAGRGPRTGARPSTPAPWAPYRQSELLAVAAMVVLSVYLRRRGSPESEPVGAAHTTTGIEG
ncbi:DUF6766 family protein [Streptomyces sp. NPDC048331]|uniref:DUF6766 family protein n=1 Tax=Streptomyces sp. NPDC048331 TaxID=3365534 RepID=UPI00371434D3